jgi:3-oxoacyl-ACP reductase-like protein
MARSIALLVVITALLGVSAFAQEPPPAPATPAAPPAAAAAPAAAQAPPPAPATPAPVTVPRIYYEKAVVEVDGKADYNGIVQLEWKPLNGQGKLVEVRVLAKAKDKDIARDLHKELTLAAGSGYKVKLSDEKVKISRTNKQLPFFSITIINLQVSGVSVRISKD